MKSLYRLAVIVAATHAAFTPLTAYADYPTREAVLLDAAHVTVVAETLPPNAVLRSRGPARTLYVAVGPARLIRDIGGDSAGFVRYKVGQTIWIPDGYMMIKNVGSNTVKLIAFIEKHSTW